MRLATWDDGRRTSNVRQLVMLSGDHEGYWRRDLFVDNAVTCLPQAELFSLELILVGENFTPHQFPLFRLLRKITWHYGVTNHGTMMDEVSMQ